MLKKQMTVFVLVMLLSSAILISYRLSTKGQSTTDLPSDIPVLYVDPRNVTGLSPGDSFTVSVKVFNLTGEVVHGYKDWQWGCPLEKGGISISYNLGDLYGLDIDFAWDPTILSYDSHNITIPVEDHPHGVLYKPILEVNDTVDESAGTYHMAYASMSPAPVFNGSGTVFTMSFTVLNPGVCSFHFRKSKLTSREGSVIPHHVLDGYFGRDVEVSRVEVQEKIARGYPADIDVTVSNLGGKTENFTLSAYYNTTANGGWKPLRLQPLPQPPLAINEQNVTNMPGTVYHYGCKGGSSGFVTSNRPVQLWWNTTGIPEGYYQVKVNTTGVSNEENATNNESYSADVIHITKPSHDMLIETLGITAQTINPKTEKHFEYPPPLICGETAKLNFTVLNNGSTSETGFNVTLFVVYPNDTTRILLTRQNLTQPPGVSQIFNLSQWDTTGLKGEYTVGANVSKVNETLTQNNQKEKTVWIVTPPNIHFTTSLQEGENLYKGDTVCFNATTSNHTMPGGNIIRWEWKVYKGDTLNYTYNGGPVMNYTFQEYNDWWTVTLNATDNYDLSYMGYDRPSTRLYRSEVKLEMTRTEGKRGGWPVMWTYLIILVSVIIALAVYVLKTRKT